MILADHRRNSEGMVIMAIGANGGGGCGGCGGGTA